MTKPSSSWAARLGHGYAHVQHGLDKAIGWGFRKVREMSASRQVEKPDSPAHPYLRRAKAIGRKTLHFLGSVGDEYYRKYEELKAQKKKEASR